MKLLFVDESGNASDPYLVHFGLVVDAYRFKSTMQAVRPELAAARGRHPRGVAEIKGSRLANGKGGWNKVPRADREALFTRICSLAGEASVQCLVSVVEHSKHKRSSPPPWARTPWLTGAASLAMSVQRINRRLPGNKGHTVLIFDDNRQGLADLSDFLVESSPEVDQFCGRGKKSEPFDRVIETAFAIKSEHSELVQVADVCAYAIRRRAELEFGGKIENPTGELTFLKSATAKFSARLIFPPGLWSERGITPAAQFLVDVSPTNLKKWLAV